MKPIVIKTENEIRISVQTVSPIVECGKTKSFDKKNFCLLIEGEIFRENEEPEEFIEPILLGKDGAKQLINELQKFLQTNF